MFTCLERQNQSQIGVHHGIGVYRASTSAEKTAKSVIFLCGKLVYLLNPYASCTELSIVKSCVLTGDTFLKTKLFLRYISPHPFFYSNEYPSASCFVASDVERKISSLVSIQEIKKHHHGFK